MLISDGLILAMLVAGALSLIGYRMRSLPILFISSLGWLISALQVYEQTGETLPMGLLFMLAVSQFFLIKSKD